MLLKENIPHKIPFDTVGGNDDEVWERPSEPRTKTWQIYQL